MLSPQLRLPLGLSLLLLGGAMLPASWQGLLEYQRDAISQGQLWRIVTGHLVHLGWNHVLLNLVGFWLIWQLFLNQRIATKTYSLILLLITFGTTTGLYLFDHELVWYRGLSGVLHGLLIWALLREWKCAPVTHGIILVLVLLKLLWEQIGGAMPGSTELVSGRVVVDAHLYGAISGALLWLLQLVTHKITSEVNE